MDISTIEHGSITTENRESFSKHMEKFETMEDAALDGMALKKLTGKPFKMPESLDKLPDDTSRADFASQAHRLLGITHAQNIEDLADLDLKRGSTADAAMDDKLAAAFKQFVVDEKLSKGDAQ